MTYTKPMPECWVVVSDGKIIGTNDEPCHIGGVDAVRYVPAADVEAMKKSAAIWHTRYTLACQNRIALRQKYGHEIEALEAEVEVLKADAEQWRAYKARKDAVLAAGMGRNPLRDAAIDAARGK